MVEASEFDSNSLREKIQVVLDQLSLNEQLPIDELASINLVLQGHLDSLLRSDREDQLDEA